MLSGHLHIGMSARPLYAALYSKALACPASAGKQQRELTICC